MGRGVFNCFIGGMLLTQLNSNIIAWILMFAFWICGIFFISLACATPNMTNIEINAAISKAGIAAPSEQAAPMMPPSGETV
jgi:hypothetical protein